MSTWVPSTSVFVPTFELGRPLRVVEVQEAHHQVKMIKQIGKEFEDGNLLVLWRLWSCFFFKIDPDWLGFMKKPYFGWKDEMEYIRDSNMEMYTVGFADGIEWSEDVGSLSKCRQASQTCNLTMTGKVTKRWQLTCHCSSPCMLVLGWFDNMFPHPQSIWFLQVSSPSNLNLILRIWETGRQWNNRSKIPAPLNIPTRTRSGSDPSWEVVSWEQTPGTPKYKDGEISFRNRYLSGLGYVPGVCWSFC